VTFTLDPQVVTALAPITAAMADTIPRPAGDVQSRRPVLHAIMAQTAALQRMATDVTVTDFHIPAGDGAQILLRWYAKSGSAVLYLHGGEMISEASHCMTPIRPTSPRHVTSILPFRAWPPG
jgi:hypothetical protein